MNLDLDSDACPRILASWNAIHLGKDLSLLPFDYIFGFSPGACYHR